MYPELAFLQLQNTFSLSNAGFLVLTTHPSLCPFFPLLSLSLFLFNWWIK